MEFTFFILGIVASVIVNLLTPSIQRWLEGTMLVNQGKRVKALHEELTQISELYTNATKLTAVITRDLFFLMTLLMIVLVLGISAIFIQAVAIQMPDFDFFRFLGYQASTDKELEALSYVFHQAAWISLYLAFLILSVFITLVIRVLSRIRKIKDFEQYKVEVAQRIKALESRSRARLSQE